MRTLAREIEGLELPAVEKISESQKEDPFPDPDLDAALGADAGCDHAGGVDAVVREGAHAARRVAKLPVKQIEKLIYPVSFYRNKAVFVKDAAAMIVTRFGGRVPSTLEEMITLPGVGRKTANLVMILAFKSSENICVDIHVHRIANRLGWVRTRTPEETEQALYKAHRQAVVADRQLVPGDVGPEHVPSGLSSMWRLRAAQGVRPGRCHADWQRQVDVMRRIFLLLAMVAVVGSRGYRPGNDITRRGARRDRGRNREGHIRDSRPIRTKRRRPSRTSSALINKRFYNGQRAHRVVPGFVMQFGDQQTRDMTKEKMWGRVAGEPIGAAEFSKLRTHVKGAVAMAHNGDASKADTQMYVTLADTPRLNGKYVVFGKVISGMDVVEKIKYADRIVRVTVREAK